MLFPTYEFCFLFLPITLCTYFILGKLCHRTKTCHLFLILASWFFYGYFNISYLTILIGSNLFNFTIASAMHFFITKQKNTFAKITFIFGINVNLLLLGYFKYYDFFIENINFIFQSNLTVMHIILPLGISFFIFQQILFLVEQYRNRLAPGLFIDYLLFVSFFPQLVAGPIVKYEEIISQLHEKDHERPNSDNLSRGIYLFVIGLFKKIILADSLALIANNGFALTEYGFCSAWVTSISYTLQIYFDFSGYSDMARGLGRMFNISLPVNFDSPYRSGSIREFWKRWHITLGRTLRECIYIPLGGNRNGLAVFILATMTTFFLSGLWHGAAWTFILWGTLYGLLIILEKIFSWEKRVPYLIRRITTLSCINFLWVLFRAESIPKALSIYRGMFYFTDFDLRQTASLASSFGVGMISQLGYLILFLVGGLSLVLASPNSTQLDTHFRCNVRTCAFCIVLLLTSVIGMTRVSNFIYFNF